VLRRPAVLTTLLCCLSISAASAQTPPPAAAQSAASSASAVDTRMAVEGALLKLLLSTTKDSNVWLAPTTLTALSSAIVAALSLGLNFYQFSRNRLDTNTWKRHDSKASRFNSLLMCLPWFGNSRQQRSLAIALVQGNWDEFPELRRTWRNAMTGQVVAIISQSATRLDDQDARDLTSLLQLIAADSSSTSERADLEIHAATIKTLVQQLPTRVVFSESGDPVHPQGRDRFIRQACEICTASPLGRYLA
jgi:hypothetical protein